MKNTNATLLLTLAIVARLIAQPCGVAQSLSGVQKSKINAIISPLDTALKYEDLFHIDSLSAELKSVYSTQAGRPDGVESYYSLVSTTTWLNLANAATLSRKLIANDSMVYVELWKLAKGRSHLLSYQPNSIPLRYSAEIAAGLLKIADKETDLMRKSIYQFWATRALDTLATMQLPNGAFPFPDLRAYGDPVFTPILKNFIVSCGADSVNVLKSGWIVDDKGMGEFKFDAGVIANAYYEAYNYTGKSVYKTIAVAVGNYLKPLKFNLNYNYNTFVSLGLTRAFQLTADNSFLDRAIRNLRYAVSPGQILNGRWVDGHNANSKYHSIIVQNIVSTIQLIPGSSGFKGCIDTMTSRAVKNMTDYSYTCGSATGYRWLIKAYGLSATLLPQTLKDSITDLIGQHINQSVINGKYLDVPTIGDYIELLGLLSGSNAISLPIAPALTVYPNPSNGSFAIDINRLMNIKELYITDIFGNILLHQHNVEEKINIHDLSDGVYILTIVDESNKATIIKLVSHCER
ncbi:MAG: T9SS type A sorting domain-containing protein [Bacteroidia bacterium]|nr:T9SS type A sorting domain-containing protein [Bacteroidia bacterium]